MRVIAGSARRLILKTPEGLNTRPTQDRIKETLFNMIQTQVPGSVFLDLCAGSGGIELRRSHAEQDALILPRTAGKLPDVFRKIFIRHILKKAEPF